MPVLYIDETLVGMFPLVLTVLNKDYDRGDYNPS